MSSFTEHISNILSGLYSLGGQVDYALFERCIDFSDVYSRFSFQGVPDVRLIVFCGYPVMSMIRLATRESDRAGEPAPGGGRRGAAHPGRTAGVRGLAQ